METTKQIVALDTETELIGPGNVIPNLVCASFAVRRPDDGQFASWVVSTHEADNLEAGLRSLLEDENVLLVFLNAGYDLAVLMRAYPRLTSLIWSKLSALDQVTDIAVREKLLNISTTGRLKTRQLPDGSFEKVRYSLAFLCKDRLGIDLEFEKGEAEDLWRYNYAELLGKRASEYPADAYRYAADDALHTLQIHEAQEREKQHTGAGQKGAGSTFGEFHRTALTLPLQLITARGMCIDPVERDRLDVWIAEELHESKHQLLIGSKILRKAEPRAPYANSKKQLAEALGCSLPEADEILYLGDFTDEQLTYLAQRGIKIKAAKKGSIDQKALHAHITAVCEQQKFVLHRTEKGSVCADESVIKKLAPVDAVMQEYQHRQSLQQIANTELPRMRAPIVHFNYDPVIESFRTSSSGGGTSPLFPATNGQNINPRVRLAYVPRPGNVFCSADYDRLELCTLAQKCLDLFGTSVMADKINAGVDLHSYLGAQIAARLHPQFAAGTKAFAGNADLMYEAFMRLKGQADPEVSGIYDKFRLLAKPTNLGFPGGLGEERFISYAASKKYNVIVDLATSGALRSTWFDTFPEMRPYFAWINQQVDKFNSGGIDEDTGRPITKYCYYSPLGLYRAGCGFTDASNGAGLQSFAADGFNLAVFNVMRACFDPEMRSVLYGTHGVAEVHDEIIAEWENDERSHDRAMEMSRLMVASMKVVCPDIRITAQPALMLRWDKKAEPVYVNERLVPWTPTEKAA